jgi:hypothetical protein
MLEAAMGFLADADPAGMPAGALAECLRVLERVDAAEAAAGDLRTCPQRYHDALEEAMR